MMVLLRVIAYLCYVIVNAQNNNIISNDYAEVRVLLDQYYKITARKYGTYHDYDSKKVSKDLRDIPADDGTEASINRKEGVVGDLFENDILLTLPQIKALLNEDIKNRNSRQAIRGEQYNWMNMPISYYFSSLDVKWQNLIRTALHHIEAETCIRFKENGSNKNYIYFTRGRGCWSNVGKIGGRQIISIGLGCESMGIVAHEVLHALGLWHEQSRSDRDSNIWINHMNIYPGTQGNFEKRTTLNTDNMGLSYDYGSLMHYGSKAFTISFDRYTIETRDRRYQQTIGQRQALSFKDAKMINLRYCNDTCRYRMNCYNGGYTNPNNCYECKCPTGLGGRNCLSVEKSKTPKCGGDLLAGYDYQNITITAQNGNVHCVWRIRSNAQVLVYVDELQLPCKATCTSYLELKFKTDMISTGSRHCCESPNAWIASESNTFIIIYTANVLTDGSGIWGFKLRYKLYDLDGSASKFLPNKKLIMTTTTTTTITTRTRSTTATTTTPTTSITTATSAWSNWGKWSACSVTCGGCGKQRRIRACYGKNQYCPGPKEDMKKCGEKRCPIWQNFNCVGRLVVPCSLYKNLQFATDKDAYMLPDDKLNVDQYKYKQYVRSAFSGERLCEKYFYHLCSMSTFTVYLGWKSGNDWLKLDRRGCCSGYHYNGTVCIPD
ncbi:Astacin (Peptidase M12A) family protein [Brugia pahangi]